MNKLWESIGRAIDRINFNDLFVNIAIIIVFLGFASCTVLCNVLVHI